MNLRVDVDRWFTPLVASDLQRCPQLCELYTKAKQLGYYLLTHIPDEAGQQTFLLQQLRMVAASAYYNWQNPRACINSTGYRQLESQPVAEYLQPLQQQSQPLLDLLVSQAGRTNMAYAIETLLALLTVAQLILSSQGAHNTAAA